MDPSIHSTVERTLTRLSLFGDGLLTYQGNFLTKKKSTLPIVVHQSMFRRFTCVAGCYVCCTMSHSLDWLPNEIDRSRATSDFVMPIPIEYEVNGKYFDVYSLDKTGPCPFLAPNRLNDGLGCRFWPHSPLECWAAVNMRMTEMPNRVAITKQPMARAWRYHPSPECQFSNVPLEEMDLETNRSIFERYFEWAVYFNLDFAAGRLQRIIDRFDQILRGKVAPVQFTIE